MKNKTDEELNQYAMVSRQNRCPCLFGPDREQRASPFDYPIGYDETCYCCKCLVELRKRRKKEKGG